MRAEAYHVIPAALGSHGTFLFLFYGDSELAGIDMFCMGPIHLLGIRSLPNVVAGGGGAWVDGSLGLWFSGT